MNRNILLSAIALVALATVVSVGVGATDLQASDGQYELSEGQAKTFAENEVGGTAQSVERENEGGPIYEVHVELSDGSAKEVEIDGQSGEVLEVEAENDDFLDDDLFGEDGEN